MVRLGAFVGLNCPVAVIRKLSKLCVPPWTVCVKTSPAPVMLPSRLLVATTPMTAFVERMVSEFQNVAAGLNACV